MKKSLGRLAMPLICLAIMLLVAQLVRPDFFNISVSNGVLYGRIIDVLNRGSEVLILSIGMTLVVSASGGTDISVGAIMAVVAAVTCQILSGGAVSVKEYQNPYVLALLAGLAAGVLCGCWNGLLVSKLKIQPMVATLILYTAGRGIAQLVTNGQITYIRVESYKLLGNSFPGFPLPTPPLLAAVVVIATVILLRKTALGLYIQSVGVNARASRLVGLNSDRIVFLVYAFCGLCAAVAGLLASSRIYSADANNIGLNLELDAILAVALGGNSLGGGKFSLTGSIIGSYTIQTLTTTLYALNVTPDQLPVYKAIVVLLIVTLQSPVFKAWFEKFMRRFKKSELQHSGKAVA